MAHTTSLRTALAAIALALPAGACGSTTDGPGVDVPEPGRACLAAAETSAETPVRPASCGAGEIRLRRTTTCREDPVRDSC